MNAISQHLAAQQQAALDTLAAAQSAMFAGFEKLVDLNLQVAKVTLDEASGQVRQVIAVKDPQAALTLAASVAQPGAEKALVYGKHVFDIVAGVQAELGKLTEAHIADGRAQFAQFGDEALEQWAGRAPAGSESAVAALKSTLANANSAYDTLTRAVKQAGDVAQTNLNAAARATFKVASDAAAASGGTAKAAARNRRATASA